MASCHPGIRDTSHSKGGCRNVSIEGDAISIISTHLPSAAYYPVPWRLTIQPTHCLLRVSFTGCLAQCQSAALRCITRFLYNLPDTKATSGQGKVEHWKMNESLSFLAWQAWVHSLTNITAFHLRQIRNTFSFLNLPCAERTSWQSQVATTNHPAHLLL